MEIRILTPADADQYSRLRREMLEHDPEAFSSSPEEHRALTLEEVRKRLGSDAGDAFVVGAFAEGRLVGAAGFYRENGLKTRHKGRIWGVYLTAGMRGKGVGRRMLDSLLERAGSIGGVEQILLSVTDTQKAAVGLDRSLGFESFGSEPRALKIGDRYRDETYMVFYLNPPAGKIGSLDSG